jgi:hypothetical protein
MNSNHSCTWKLLSSFREQQKLVCPLQAHQISFQVLFIQAVSLYFIPNIAPKNWWDITSFTYSWLAVACRIQCISSFTTIFCIHGTKFSFLTECTLLQRKNHLCMRHFPIHFIQVHLITMHLFDTCSLFHYDTCTHKIHNYGILPCWNGINRYCDQKVWSTKSRTDCWHMAPQTQFWRQLPRVVLPLDLHVGLARSRDAVDVRFI